MKLIQSFVNNSLSVNLLSVIIVVVGLVTVSNMKREAFPLVYFDQMTVETSFPGASAREVEQLVTIPIERALKEVEGIEEIRSLSAENFCKVVVKIDEDEKDKDRVKEEIQRAVDRVTDLPKDAEKPLVTEISTNQQPIIEISLSGAVSEEELRKSADLLEDELELVDGVANIVKRGYRKREMWVELDPEKLSAWHISFDQVVAALAEQNVNIPGGLLKDTKKEYTIRTSGEFHTTEEIGEVIVRANPSGYHTKVKDIGRVLAQYEEDEIIEKTNGFPSLNLVILKRESGDAIDVVDSAKKIVGEAKPRLHPHLQIEYVNDFSYFIKRRLGILINNGWMGLILLFAAMLFFLTPRLAIMTTLEIPVVFLLCFLVLAQFGISVNLISMFGLVIVMGMLVDDSIIVAENIYRHIEKGMPPKQAAVLGTSEVMKPVIGIVLTTIAAFAPLAFMKGMLGKFVWQIPAVVVICLLASIIESFFALPSHCADFVKAPKRKEGKGSSHWMEKVYPFYTKTVAWFVRRKYKVLLTSLVILALSIGFAFRFLGFELFPPHGIEIFFIRVEAPVGTPVKQTSKLMESIEKIVAELPSEELDAFTTQAGIQMQDPTDPYLQKKSHVGQIVVYLTPENKRERSANEIVDDLRQRVSGIKELDHIYFERVKPGPPVGKPLVVELRGDDYSTLMKLSSEAQTVLREISGVKDVRDDYVSGKPELGIRVNKETAYSAGLNVGQIARTIRNAFEGGIATTIHESDEDIQVRVRLVEKAQHDINSLSQLLIQTPQGHLVPLGKVAELQDAPGISDVKRVDHKRVITVTADVDQKIVTPYEANRQVAAKVKELIQPYPGYHVHLGGEQEKTQETLSDMYHAFGIALLAIFLILVTTLGSITQSFVVMFAIPLGMIGVIITFYVHQLPLSFMALLGVVGLSGVVVNDSIILVNFINHLRREGYELERAVIEGGRLRLRPVLLTTVTTVIGLAPISYGLGGSDPILLPTALALSWGLVFATFLTLIITPCGYLMIEDVRTLSSSAAEKWKGRLRKKS
ncbi:MAG: efflux RND transporter permease subunit [Deltaproteobacteria bacterium]|nr:efflux RND transporter permease subunit [Deltaproteobacteria bacterium]